MDEMYEIVHPTTHRFLGIEEVHKLMMDEMDKTGNLLRNLDMKPVLLSLFWLLVLCLIGCLVCMIQKIGLYTLSLRYEREYPPFCLVYMTFLMPSVIKLGCKR